MVTFGRSMFCTDAEPYYYDYLCGLDADIPRAAADHIRHCAHCRGQIRQLKDAIAESETPDCAPEAGTDVIEALGLHFAHLGEDITCTKAKSFLPVLLVPSQEIRIPTPITVHVDHCRACTEDLELIRELELRPEQLARLSRLYAVVSDDDPQMCRRARSKIWAFACASFEGIDAEVLNHICVCPRCRRRVHRCRQEILVGRQPGDTIPGIGLCGGISTADLFEWVVPYGRTSGGHGHVCDGDEGTPSHLQACPECIERMQALHRTIYSVAERVDSGVSTIYTTGSGAATSSEEGESLYSRYPIRVDVAHREPEPAVTRLQPIAGIREAMGRRLASPQLRPVLKAGLLAAAMIPLAIALFVNIQPASALRVRDLSDAIMGIQNLHLTRYGPGETRVVEELWMTRSEGWVVRQNVREQTLYDLTRREKMVRDRERRTFERTPLTQDEYANVMRTINATLEQALGDTPRDGRLKPVAFDAAEGIELGEAAREYTWDRLASNGLVMQRRLRVLLDSAKGLPRKVESSRLTPDEGQWQQMDTYKFDYPTRQEIELDIQGLFPEWGNHSGDQRGL